MTSAPAKCGAQGRPGRVATLCQPGTRGNSRPAGGGTLPADATAANQNDGSAANPMTAAAIAAKTRLEDARGPSRSSLPGSNQGSPGLRSKKGQPAAISSAMTKAKKIQP